MQQELFAWKHAERTTDPNTEHSGETQSKILQK